jgi:hypothetical protein
MAGTFDSIILPLSNEPKTVPGERQRSVTFTSRRKQCVGDGGDGRDRADFAHALNAFRAAVDDMNFNRKSFRM